MSDGASATTTLERVLPGTATASQSTVARATIGNADGLWRPGSAVQARVTVARAPAALVVPLARAADASDGERRVHRAIGDTYEAAPVELGERDGRNVEVLAGLERRRRGRRRAELPGQGGHRESPAPRMTTETMSRARANHPLRHRASLADAAR